MHKESWSLYRRINCAHFTMKHYHLCYHRSFSAPHIIALCLETRIQARLLSRKTSLHHLWLCFCAFYCLNPIDSALRIGTVEMLSVARMHKSLCISHRWKIFGGTLARFNAICYMLCYASYNYTLLTRTLQNTERHKSHSRSKIKH